MKADIHRLIAESYEIGKLSDTEVGFHVGDVIKVTPVFRHFFDSPLYGVVTRVGPFFLSFNHCDRDGALKRERGSVGGTIPDFVLMAEAELERRPVEEGSLKRVSLLPMIKDAEALERVARDPCVEYVSTEYQGFLASCLANPFAVKGVSREQAKIDYEAKILQPAVEGVSSDVLDELLRLADRVMQGSKIKIACWCKLDQPCHGDSIIAAVTQLIEEQPY